MRSKLVLVALLLPALALARAFNPLLPRPAKALGGDTAVVFSGPFTTPGGLLQDDANTVSHVTFDGIQNVVIQNNTLTNVAWTKRGAATATTDGTLCPDGSLANKITVGQAGVDDIFVGAAYNASPVGLPIATSLFAKLISTTCAGGSVFSVGSTANGGNYGIAVNQASIPTTQFARFTGVGSVPVGGQLGAQIIGSGCVGGSTFMNLYVCQIQVEPGRYTPGTYVSTTTAAYRGALVDSKGLAWTKVGTINADSNTPLYPRGFGAPARKSAGPFATTNRYDLGTGSDVLDFTGDFTVCTVFTLTTAATRVFIDNGTFNVEGYWIQEAASGQMQLMLATAGSSTFLTTSNVAVLGNTGVNIFCAGRAGTTMLAKLNLGTTATTAGPAITPGTSSVAHIGAGNSLSSALTDGTLHEVWFSSTTPSDALFTAIQQRFFGMTGASGETLSVARTTTGTYTTPDGLVWTAPVNILRLGCEDTAATKCGALAEPARTNVALQSEAIDNASWTKTVGITTTADQGALPTLGPANSPSTMEKLVGAVGTVDNANQTVTVASSTGPFTTSASFASTTGGTVNASIGGFCPAANNVASVSCVRSDGGTCTTGTATVNGWGAGLVGPATVRFMLTFTCTAATTAPGIFIAPGTFNTNTNATILAGAAQFEVGSPATSYIPTTTVAVARNADSVSAPNPLAGGMPAWCVDGTYTPENFRAWGSMAGARFFSMGISGTANSVRAFEPGGAVVNMDVFDASSAVRTINRANGAAAGSAHTIGFQATPPALEAFGDHAALTGGAGLSGAGTGVLTTPPASVFIGSNLSTGQEFGGWINSFKVYRTVCR